MTEEDLEQAKHTADELAPKAAALEAAYRDLLRREPAILAHLIELFKGDCKTYQWAKNRALNTEGYAEYLNQLKKVQEEYLTTEKSFKILTDWIRAYTAFMYKENSRMKAGL